MARHESESCRRCRANLVPIFCSWLPWRPSWTVFLSKPLKPWIFTEVNVVLIIAVPDHDQLRFWTFHRSNMLGKGFRILLWRLSVEGRTSLWTTTIRPHSMMSLWPLWKISITVDSAITHTPRWKPKIMGYHRVWVPREGQYRVAKKGCNYIKINKTVW